MTASAACDRRLIITADDFGVAPEVNEAVALAHRQGVLTAASLMVGGSAAAAAVNLARTLPALRLGLHLVLVEGRPILPPDKVSMLVDASGWFRADMARAGVTLFFNPTARRQLAAEIEAQFAAFAATGLALDHVNAHKHFHLHPTIGGLIARIGPRFGLKAARAPVEPQADLVRAEPGGEGRPARFVAAWARLARLRLRAAGLQCPDRVFGLAWSGAMTRGRLAALIAGLRPGTTEIYLHPATGGGFVGAAAGYRYADELAALLAPEAKAAIAASGARLGGFFDFRASDR